MNKISGSILILAAAVTGHAVMLFLAAHPRITKYDVPSTVANMVLVAIATAAVLGLWGFYQIVKKDPH